MVGIKQRDYEVSIWTLQDEFITLLKSARIENRGQIITPKLHLNTDGTQEFSFSLPMYIYRDGVRQENPIWYNARGNIIVNMRKIKVILNKARPEERVFDFLITKVVERHEKDELYCDVTCEGLAFHELGKIGYKISFDPDAFYEEDFTLFEQYYEAHSEGEEPPEQPCPTLQYWLNKFLVPLPAEGMPLKANVWYYDVQMDWSSYANADQRDSSKVYEEPYTASWETQNGQLVPTVIEGFREKERILEKKEESNIYNLTQEIAETFGIFCRYEYGYDDNYHINSRKIIFYNNFIQEKQGYISLTYPYSTNKVSREIDSTELVTKMFIKPAESEGEDNESITIMDVEANKSLEDYILGFDYLYKNGGITEEQHAAIADYEVKIHDYNVELIALYNKLQVLENQLPDLKARITITENAIQLEQERINEANDVLNNLDLRDYEQDGMITVSANNPKNAVLQPYTSGHESNMYYIKISEQGIIPSTLRIFKELNFSSSENRLARELSFGKYDYDEFGNLIQVNDIYTILTNNDSKMVYLTYKYRPVLHYENVKQTWERRLANDLAQQEADNELLENLQTSIEQMEEERNALLTAKSQVVAEFENMMGPALREGYWQPEDYNDYGNRYTDFFQLPALSTSTVQGDSGYTTCMWDSIPFDNEQKITYDVGVIPEEYTYPCIKLSHDMLEVLQEHYNDNLAILYFDYVTSQEGRTPHNMRSMALGSLCQLGFCTDATQTIAPDSNAIVPVLILTGAESLTDTELDFLINNENAAPTFGTLITTINTEDPLHPTVVTEIPDWGIAIEPSDWFIPNQIFYPRIKVNSLKLKIDDEQLSMGYGDIFLHNYSDYSVLFRDAGENGNEEAAYYITPRAEAILQTGGFGQQIGLKFTISNADIAIYLDALQVLKENSQPKVSYEVAPSSINQDFIYDDYNKLARIVNINDTDLKFEDVQGYISELELNLEHPWEDTITIKNYKTKFEDLFSKIVAQTEAMQKNEYTIGLAASIFAQPGQIAPELIQNSIERADLAYAFNNGTLTIDEANGIWGVSDSGVVAMRGGGVFTATQKDENDNWIWNTGILPSGINANLITTGQLDTNLIRIFAGDQLRFQMNGDGLFAYKSVLNDQQVIDNPTDYTLRILNKQLKDDIDTNQYVVHNSEGLFLKADEGACVFSKQNIWFIFGDELYDINATYDPRGKTYMGIATTQENALNNNYSWQKIGLNQQVTKYALHVVGNTTYYLYIVFSDNATGQPFTILPPESAQNVYIGLQAGATSPSEDNTDYNFFLYDFNARAEKAGQYSYYEIKEMEESVDRVEISWDGLKLRNWNNDEVFYADPNTGDLTMQGTLYATNLYIGDQNQNVPISNYVNGQIGDRIKRTYYQPDRPSADYRQGEIWYNSQNQNYYIATNDWAVGSDPAADWAAMNTKISGTNIITNTNTGEISIQATSSLELESAAELNIQGGKINIAADSELNFFVNNEVFYQGEEQAEVSNFYLSKNFDSISSITINGHAIEDDDPPVYTYTYDPDTHLLTFTQGVPPANSEIVVYSDDSSSIMINQDGISINAASEFKVLSGGIIQMEAKQLLWQPELENYIRFSREVSEIVDGVEQITDETILSINNEGIFASSGTFTNELTLDDSPVLNRKWVNVPILFGMAEAPTIDDIDYGVPLIWIHPTDLTSQLKKYSSNCSTNGGGAIGYPPKNTYNEYLTPFPVTEQEAYEYNTLTGTSLRRTYFLNCALGSGDYIAVGNADKFKYVLDLYILGRAPSGQGVTPQSVKCKFYAKLYRKYKNPAPDTNPIASHILMYSGLRAVNPDNNRNVIHIESSLTTVNLLVQNTNELDDYLYLDVWVTGNEIYSFGDAKYSTHNGVNVFITIGPQNFYGHSAIITCQHSQIADTSSCDVTYYSNGIGESQNNS